MPRSQRKATVGRRDVLRAMVAGVGASAVPLASNVEAAESGDDKRKARYRLSDHVKAYYRVNHYPSK